MASFFSYYFRKYPLFRVAVLFILVLLVFGSYLLFFVERNPIPVIAKINPPIGSPGDILVVNGSGFGKEKKASFVEIGGSRLTTSSYLSWTDTEIKVELPSNIQDGLVFVETRYGRSEPVIFANKENIPVAITQMAVQSSVPSITHQSHEKISVGQVLTITGDNFGTLRGDNSAVYFTAQWTDSKNASDINVKYLTPSENDFDYEYWSNTEIRVRVPDGAVSGHFFVKTDKGISNQRNITVTSTAGTKSYENMRSYIVQVSADISDINADKQSLITLRVPRPSQYAVQPYIQMTECQPTPIFENYNQSVIHQLQTNAVADKKFVFNQTFVVPVYEVNTEINSAKVEKYSEKNRLLYVLYTSSDSCIPSDTPQIQELADSIVGKETNPYKQARLIYDYILQNYRLSDTLITSEAGSLNMLTTLQGDAYDFSIIFTALCRAVGIPAIPVSGLLTDFNKKSQNHWWSEIYIEKFGWIPVDVSIAAGLQFSIQKHPDNLADFYFGNLDNQHIAFSRGWKEVNPSIVNNKTVYRPKTYGLQSIWEESTTGVVSYSSLWSNPLIVGFY